MSRTNVYRGIIGVALVAAMVAGVAASAWAQGPRSGRFGAGAPFGPGLPPLHVLAVALELTDAQQDQIRSILQGHRASIAELRPRMRSAHQALTQAIRAPQVNEGAIRSAVNAWSQVQGDAAVLRARVRQEVLAQLTPEQREKAERLEASPRGRKRDRAARPGGQPQNR